MAKSESKSESKSKAKANKPKSEFETPPLSFEPSVEEHQPGSYAYEKESGRIKIDLLGSTYTASIEDSGIVMSMAVDALRAVKDARTVVLVQDREYEYDHLQTDLLKQMASFLEYFRRKKIITPSNVALPNCNTHIPTRIAFLQDLVTNYVRMDPIGGYVRLKRYIEEVTVGMTHQAGRERRCYLIYLNTLRKIKEGFEELEIIQKVKARLPGHRIGNRDIYRQIFHPTIRPNFMLTRYTSAIPENGREVERYEIKKVNTEVRIFKVPGAVRLRYHVSPPEFNLDDTSYSILDTARRYMSEHEPTEAEFAEPERTRKVFYNIGKDMITDIALNRGVELDAEKIEELANILTRYTAGLGILEIVLADENLQDIYVNAPVGRLPVFALHAKYGECITNLIPTREDAESWATRFRMKSGRPLDEASPVLDTDTEVPGGRARVAIITKSLSPEGLSFAFRRHRSMPWTLPLFIDVKMLNPLAAGLLSFIIDGARTMLIAGTRSAGKTSLMSALLTELMKKYRVVSVEDSVTGDCEITCKINGEFVKSEVGALIDSMFEKYGSINKNSGPANKNAREILNLSEVPSEKIEVFSITEAGKLKLSPASALIRHKVDKKIYEVETRTGKRIRVTEDHSLFTLNDSGEMSVVKTKDLRVGDPIVTPRILKFKDEEVKYLDLTKHANKLNGFFVSGEITSFIKNNRRRVLEVAEKLNYAKSAVRGWARTRSLPARVFGTLELEDKLGKEELRYKSSKNSVAIKCRVALDFEFLAFLGMWLAEGCYNKKSLIVPINDREAADILDVICKRFGCTLRRHSDNLFLMLNSRTIKEIMVKVLDLTGTSHSKRAPQFLYNLSERQRGWFLKGLFTGGGYLAKYEIGIDLINKKLLGDIQTLLLGMGVVARMRRSGGRGRNVYNTSKSMNGLRISGVKFIKQFRNKVGFLQKHMNRKLWYMCSDSRKPTHDASDAIPYSFSRNFKEKPSTLYPHFNRTDYIVRNNNMRREKLEGMSSLIENEIIADTQTGVLLSLKNLSDSDIFWDEIRAIRTINPRKGVYVYDFSVPGTENFVCENILAHNTLELPISSLIELGYNIERMKSRSVITHVESELPADEAIRTALRLGDSVLIVGEVRSVEARALYEAMRIGALANFVGGTIHGDSAYGVFDRVVNDLGVPATSFKATDIIVIANTLKSPDGLQTFRRVVAITEVRKEWEKDPLKEKAFVDLMVYDAKQDKLVPTDVLLNGESTVLNSIAANVREWKNEWDSVWSNIQLRAKIKEHLVRVANENKRKDILEASFTVKSNEKFHEISEEVRKEYGTLDSEKIYKRWEAWLASEL